MSTGRTWWWNTRWVGINKNTGAVESFYYPFTATTSNLNVAFSQDPSKNNIKDVDVFTYTYTVSIALFSWTNEQNADQPSKTPLSVYDTQSAWVQCSALTTTDKANTATQSCLPPSM